MVLGFGLSGRDAFRVPVASITVHGTVLEVMVVRLLLERGVDVNSATDDGCTALYFASDYGHLDVVRLLLGRVGSNCARAVQAASSMA